MRKRIRVAKLVSLGIVFVFTLSVLIGCGGVSIKVIEKQNILGDEIVTAYVSNFKNEDATWQKLQNFGDNFDKNVDYLTIYFFNDRNKIPKLKSLEFLSLDASSEGVVAVYERYGGEGSLDKNPEFEKSTQNSAISENQENSEASNSQEKSNPETEKPQPAPKVEFIPVTYTASYDKMGLEITATSITLSTDPISGEQTVTVTVIAKNLSDRELHVPNFWLLDEKYHNKFSADSSSVSADINPIPSGAKTRITFSVKLPGYVSINNVDLGCDNGWYSMWEKLTPTKADLGTPIFTATGDYGFLSVYSVATLPQDGNNELGDESKQYLMIEVEVNETNDSYASFCYVSKDSFSLLDKDEFAYPQVDHNPQYMTSGSARLWRGQLFFAVPKDSPPSNYSLIFNTSSWSQKAKTVVDLSKLTTR